MGQLRPRAYSVVFALMVLGACTSTPPDVADGASAPTSLPAEITTSAPTTLPETTVGPLQCGDEALIDGVLTDNAEVVSEVLFTCRADPNITANGKPLLHLAAIRDHGPTVSVLLAFGANPDGVGANGATALMEAALQDSAEAAFALLDVGANPNVAIDDAEGRKAIHIAAANGAVDVLDVFVENGLDIGVTDNFGNHALIFAVIANQPDFVDAMLATGMDPDLPGGKGLVAMDHAIAWNLPDIMDSIRAARWLQPAPSG